jgi:hypothetical protein
MSRFGTDYHVSRPSGQCAATGEPLEPGTPCVAALSEREADDGFDRLDYRLDAWEAGARPERLFSYWQFTVPPREEKRKLLVDDEVLVDLFERLADDERPQRVAFRFVLGLILMRKRLLRFVGRRAGADRTETWLLRARGDDADATPHEVVNPRLEDEDVRELTSQLSEILESEL